jgi:uncharacterized repeat protein (TIGR01451 family)
MVARPPRVVLLATAALALSAAAPALAAPTFRHREQLNGDFTLIGNTLAHDCSTAGALLTTGTVSACGSNSGDSGVDAFWQVNLGTGTATASNATPGASASSSAWLDATSIPAAATVTYARLYWGAHNTTQNYGPSTTLITPDGVAHSITADPLASTVIVAGTDGYWYQSSANITAIVQSLGTTLSRGRYTVSGISSVSIDGANDQTSFAAWWIVLIYANPGETAYRDITIFDGLDYVQSGAPADVTFGDFLVPSGGWDAKLGVVTYEGDSAYSGDALAFKGYKSTGPMPAVGALTTLSDALNPANNFFNGTRSWLGVARSVAGDLPRYTGAAASMQSFDMDVVDLKALGAIAPGDDSARIYASSSVDRYALGAFITSINTLKPSFLKTVKSVTRVPDDGGAIMAGTMLEYLVSTRNTGNDPSILTVLQDAVPGGVTYVPGSIEVQQNGGAWVGYSDALGDDVAEFVTSTRTIAVRLGSGASATTGGTMAIGDWAQVRFRVTVDAGASGTIQNRAEVLAAGQSGEPLRSFDSNPPFGSGTTDMPVDQCATDAQCGNGTPACWTAPTPNVCVACTADSYCSGTPSTPICDTGTHTCVPRVTLTPATQAETVVAGTAAPFTETLTSYLSQADVFNLDVLPGAACGTWGITLRTPGGVVIGTRSGGVWSIPSPASYDTDSNGSPDLGSIGGPGAASFVLWLTPPGGTAVGTACDVVVTASGRDTGFFASAAATLHVGASATWTPSYTGATTRIVPTGGDAAFAGVIQNNTGAPLTFTLTNTTTANPAQGTVLPVTFYSDPNGDGDLVDGDIITTIGPVAPYGGLAHVVLVVHAMNTTGTPHSIGTVLTSTSTATSGSVTATQTATAQVHYAAPYSDSGRTLLANAFTPCDTVYLGASHLPAGYPFAVEWYAKANPVRGTDTPFRSVDPWPVSGGNGTDALQLPATALGTWTVLVVQKTATPTVMDTMTFTVERAGAFTSFAAPAHVVPGGSLSVNAAVRSDNAYAIFDSTHIAYTVSGGGLYMAGAGTFSATPGTTHLTGPVAVAPGASFADAWLVAAPVWPGPGTYQLDGTWQVQCGGVTQAIAQATTTFQVAPAAPVITSPLSPALVSTRTPSFSGTGIAGAAVTLTVGTASCGAVVGAGGTWACTVGSSLGDGTYPATATQVVSGATSDPSAAVTVTVDGTPPAVAIVAPSGGALLNAAATPGGIVHFTGTAEPGADVVLRVGGTSTPAGSSGAWSADVSLVDGTYVATAEATDAAGNVGRAPVTFTLDRTPPPPPDVNAVASPTNAEPIPVTGSVDASASVVELFLDGVSQGTRATSAGFSYSLSGVSASATHQVYAVARDTAGNVSGPSGTVSFYVDRTAPGLATLDVPADGAWLSATLVTFSGTAESGSTVTLEIDGALLVYETASAGGTWATTYGLAPGAHQARVRATDAAGNAGPWSDSSGFTIDTAAPDAPVLDGLETPTSSADVLVTGTEADVGATVGIYVDGVFVGTAAGTGGFSLAVTSLAEGPHTIRARALDLAGNVSAFSDPIAVTVDWTPPAAPGIDPLVTPTNAAGVTVTGTTDPSTVVSVYRNGVFAGAAPEAGGRFSLYVALGEGSWTFTATAADLAGNVSGFSTIPRTVVVDRTAPSAPSLDPLVTPTNATTIVVTGTTDAGTTVTVLQGGTAVGTVADDAGRFSLAVAVTEGTYTFTATAADAAGNVSGVSNTRTVVVDLTAPAAPVLDPLVTPTNASSVVVGGSSDAGTTVTLLRDGVAVATAPVMGGRFSAPLAVFAGSFQFTATASDAAGNVSPVSNTVPLVVDHSAPAVPVLDPLVTPTNATSAVATGHADPGSAVAVYVGGVLAGVTVAAADGTFAVPVGLSDGDNVLTANAADAAGNVSADSDPVTVRVDRIAPDAPLLGALDSPTGASTVTVAGTAEPSSRVTIYRDGVEVGTATAGPTGVFALDVGVAEGTLTFTAVATDAAGNASIPSAPVGVVVDHSLPAPPVLATLLSPTNATTVTVTGTAEAGATVVVSLDGTVVGTVVATGGTFSLAVGVPEGDLAFTAVAHDLVGHVSAQSNTVFVTVDRTAPAVPLIVTPPNGAHLGAAAAPAGAVTLGGGSDTLTTVELDVDGAVTTVPAATGAWGVVLPLADGPHQARARARDLAGNVSAWSASSAFTLDTVAPAQPFLDPIASPTTAATIDVSGTAEAGSTVTILRDGTSVGTVVATGGTFHLVVTMGEGTFVFTTTAADAAGNTATGQNARTVVIDRTAPAAPVLDPLVTPTNAVSVLVTGHAEAGATVTVFRGGAPVGTVVATGGVFALSVPVAEGSSTFTATAADAASNVSGPSNAVSVLVDRTAPAAPVLAVVSPTRAEPVSVTGSADAGTVVELFLDGVSQGTQPAAPGFTFPLAGVPEGSHTLTAVARDAAGNPSPVSVPAALLVDRTGPGLATVDVPADGATLGAAAAPGGVVGFSGTSEAASTVEVEVDGVVLGIEPALAGTWAGSWTLSQGPHQVRVRATDAAGNVGSWSASSSFSLDTAAPLAPVLDVLPTPTNATSIVVTGTVADPGATVGIYVDGTFVGTATGSGGFSFTLAPTEGSHVVTAAALDGAGNPSGPSNSVSVVVDRTPPGAPTIDPLVTPTNAAPVPVGGHAEPGATVSVLVDGVVVGTTVAAGDGSWSVPVTAADGNHTLTAVATDGAGNASGASGGTAVAVDTHAPAAPVFAHPIAGATLPAGTVLLEGTAEAGATVRVVLAGATYVTVADADGRFQVTSAALPAGSWTATATALDAVSNASAPASVAFATAAPSAGAGGHIVGGGCGCTQGGGSPASALLLVGFALALAPRRRARAEAR